MTSVYEILHKVFEKSRDLSEELVEENFEMFRRNGNAGFREEPLIRQQVFKSDEEAKMADMSSPEGVKYMKYVARRMAIFGGK